MLSEGIHYNARLAAPGSSNFLLDLAEQRHGTVEGDARVARLPLRSGVRFSLDDWCLCRGGLFSSRGPFTVYGRPLIAPFGSGSRWDEIIQGVGANALWFRHMGELTPAPADDVSSDLPELLRGSGGGCVLLDGLGVACSFLEPCALVNDVFGNETGKMTADAFDRLAVNGTSLIYAARHDRDRSQRRIQTLADFLDRRHKVAEALRGHSAGFHWNQDLGTRREGGDCEETKPG